MSSPISAKDLEPNNPLSGIREFEKGWPDVRNTLLYEMKSGMKKSDSGRPFTHKEVAFAAKDSNPTYVIRIARHYPASLLVEKKKEVVPLLKSEVNRMKGLVQLAN